MPGRGRRVRAMTTREIEKELREVERYIRATGDTRKFYDCTEELIAGLEAHHRALWRRWFRLERERRKRLYVWRDHGRQCWCEECWELYQGWVRIWRRQPS